MNMSYPSDEEGWNILNISSLFGTILFHTETFPDAIYAMILFNNTNKAVPSFDTSILLITIIK